MADITTILINLLTGALGIFMAVFTVLNAVSDIGNPFGTFGTKFIYEMDEIMGGQLGLPHYSKIEVLFLGLSAAGAGASLFTDQQLLPVLGWVSCCGYMGICCFYSIFVGMPTAPFAAFGVVSGFLLKYRWDNHLDSTEDMNTAINFGIFMCILTVFCGIVMKIREPARREINARFVKISKYCEENPNFEWKKGDDAPQGFAA